jgi:hypothetical protein
MFKKVKGDWKNLKDMSAMIVDLHFGRGEPGQFSNNMAEVADIVMQEIKAAQAKGCAYVTFMHGYSTSKPGETTARSIVRGIMRSKESTPFVIKSQSMQHNSVFVAAIRPASHWRAKPARAKLRVCQ